MTTLLFTGASGFLGQNIKPLLRDKYDVKTIGLASENNYQVDLSQSIPILDQSFSVVLHAAGKAHLVPNNKGDEKVFFDVNYQGTVNLCKALENVGVPQSLIFISTVSVYGLDKGLAYTEDMPLNGSTPYAKSKIMAEEYLRNWSIKHHVILSILRPSLIAGTNPPGNLGSMIRGIQTGHYLSIAGGTTRRSIVMAEDIAKLIPLLAYKGGIYNVASSQSPTFHDLETLISSQLGKNLPISIPYWIAKLLALCGDCCGANAPINSHKLDKITSTLTFSNAKAIKELGWNPMSIMDNFRIR